MDRLMDRCMVKQIDWWVDARFDASLNRWINRKIAALF